MPCIKNYSGWVPVRRGLAEHRDLGDMSDQRYHVWGLLLVACNYETGIVEDLTASQMANFIGLGITAKQVWKQMKAMIREGALEDLRKYDNEKYKVRIVKWFHENGPQKSPETKGNGTIRSQMGVKRQTKPRKAVGQQPGVSSAKETKVCPEGEAGRSHLSLHLGDNPQSDGSQVGVQPYKEEKEDLEEMTLPGQDGQDDEDEGMSKQEQEAAFRARQQRKTTEAATRNQALIVAERTGQPVPSTPKPIPALVEAKPIHQTTIPAKAASPDGESFADQVARLLPDCYQTQVRRNAAALKLAPLESDREYRAAVEWALITPNEWWGTACREMNHPHAYIAKNRDKWLDAYRNRRTSNSAKQPERRIAFGNSLTLEGMKRRIEEIRAKQAADANSQ
jgi:hypothetical protein